MNIIAANTEDKKELYRLTHAVKTGKVIDLAGQTVTVDKWVMYTDDPDDPDDPTEKTKEVLTMVLDTGEIVGTISKTFIKEFRDILDVLGELPPLMVETSTTKNGRTFVFPVPV